MITLREIREEDSAALLQLNKMLDRESKFMLLEADERKLTEEQQREMLRDIIRLDNSHIFVAEAEGIFANVFLCLVNRSFVNSVFESMKNRNMLFSLVI